MLDLIHDAGTDGRLADLDGLASQYRQIRACSETLARPLSAEDQCIQSMPDASPTKWHLAHTTWFFETLVCQIYLPDYQVFDPAFHYLFNSYYEALGPRHPRMQRGLLTRPSCHDILAYRAHVDAAMQKVLEGAGSGSGTASPSLADVVTLGLQHEQQHQELLLTDILHALSCNPTLPAYAEPLPARDNHLAASMQPELNWLHHTGGMTSIGWPGAGSNAFSDPGPDTAAFAFDNETPRHQRWLQPFAIASRLVNCGDFARFIADGGYQRAELWLSDGWATVKAQELRAPVYWVAADDARLGLCNAYKGGTSAADWHVFGLNGLQPMQPEQPVAQLSFYEAAAYAEWAGARLPTEFEWEAAFAMKGICEMQGHVWQWTRSSYDPYPGFRPLSGIAAEYNGKFMVNQLVLRGSSLATPSGHARPTYRNFFPPGARWQFSGLRLAKDN